LHRTVYRKNPVSALLKKVKGEKGVLAFYHLCIRGKTALKEREQKNKQFFIAVMSVGSRQVQAVCK
jgi:hypothetical protein